jgi:hydroxymethylglutaryl-CoA lyase
MVTAATESFAQRNQGTSVDETLRTWEEIAPLARAAGMRAQITISVAFGCPFEGEVSRSTVIGMIRRLAKSQPMEIAVADTIGVAVPSDVTAMIQEAKDVCGEIPLRCHFHNTRNTAVANGYAAVTAGVSVLDSSVGGLGGCPFAPNATGNVATEDLIYMLHRAGFATGIDIDRLIEAAHWLQLTRGQALPGMVSRAGTFPKRRFAI